MKNIQPALFVSGYTRKCESDRQPEILDKKDTEDLEEYVDYIQYPEDEYYYHCRNIPLRKHKILRYVYDENPKNAFLK